MIGTHWLRAAVGVLAWTALAGVASAQEVTGVSVHMPLLTYTTADKEVKPDGGDTTKSSTSTMATAPLGDSYVTLSWGKVSVYVYPFADLKMTSLSYMVTPQVEVGLDLGLNSESVDKPKSESSNNTVGVFTTYYAELGKNSLEAVLIIDSTQGKKEETTADATGVETKVKSSSSDLLIKPSVTFLMPVTTTLKYFAGAAYSMMTSDGKVGDAKEKTTTSAFQLTLAGVRFTL